MNNLFRLVLSGILGFGWLFLAPAYSDDPLSLAAQEIQELNKSVSNLNYKNDLISLIDIAENKYDEAVDAKESKDSTSNLYDESVSIEAISLAQKDFSQSNVDGQTVTVATALSDKNDSQDALNIANLNVQTTQSNMQSANAQGLQYTVYNLARVWPNVAVPSGVICSGVWNSSSMQLPVCGNRYENIVVKFTGQITVPSHWTSTYFAGYTDDGFRMFVDGQLAVNNWVEQGVRWSAFSPVYDVSQDKTLDVEIWWYNGGGPGSYHLGWAIPGGWTGAGCDFTGEWGVGFSCDLGTFSSGSGATQAQIDAYNQAVSDQIDAQNNYNSKLSIYNQEVSTLNTMTQDLNNNISAYNIAQNNTAQALQNKEDAEDAYEQSIIDLNIAIDNAWEYYNFQKERELLIAIAQALANQPQPEPTPEPEPSPLPSPEPSQPEEPKPEPSSEPTPSPSPEPTQPDDPTPTPSPDTTDEPKPEPTPEPEPTPQPSPKPSPQPTDINPKPTPEPEPTPAEPFEEPSNNNTTEDLSSVIANLTSKDNIVVKLTKEQMAAVSNTLSSLSVEAKVEVAKDFGIKTEEVTIIAKLASDNPAVAAAVISFAEKAAENTDAPMPYTLADAITEAATEQLLADPIGALTNIDFEKVFSPSEWGKDMTDDQREKAQEVVIPVIIASNIVAAAMTRRI